MAGRALQAPGCPAGAQANEVLESRGKAPRIYRNALVFLAVDKNKLQELDEAVRRYLAWASIVAGKEELNLSTHQIKQAQEQRAGADAAVAARLPEAYQWLLVPVQESPEAAVQWQAFRLAGQDALAVRASKRLRKDELMYPVLAGTRLRMEIDRVPLWRGDHVEIKQLAEDFGRYIYLPRLKSTAVLAEAVTDGLALTTWAQETFAYADSFDEETGRYRGLRCGERVGISADTLRGLLVHPGAAVKQRQRDAEAGAGAGAGTGGGVPA